MLRKPKMDWLTLKMANRSKINSRQISKLKISSLDKKATNQRKMSRVSAAPAMSKSTHLPKSLIMPPQLIQPGLSLNQDNSRHPIEHRYTNLRNHPNHLKGCMSINLFKLAHQRSTLQNRLTTSSSSLVMKMSWGYKRRPSSCRRW